MSEARTKPSRIVKQVEFTVGNLPTTGNNSLTATITGLPARGIIHRITVNFVNNQPFPQVASSTDGLFVHRLGSVAGSGVNTMTDAHIQSIVFAGALDFESGGLAGSGASYTTGKFLRSVTVTTARTGTGTGGFFGAVTPVYYDTYGTNAATQVTTRVLGPNASDGVLFFSIISGGSNFQEQRASGSGATMQQVWLEVEIEPCY